MLSMLKTSSNINLKQLKYSSTKKRLIELLPGQVSLYTKTLPWINFVTHI